MFSQKYSFILSSFFPLLLPVLPHLPTPPSPPPPVSSAAAIIQNYTHKCNLKCSYGTVLASKPMG
jgi:hypothetical protein